MEWVIPALALVILCLGVWVHHQLSGLRRAVEPAWIDLDTALRRRHDQVSPLIQLLRGQLRGKAKGLDAATQARKMATESQLSPESTAKAEQALTRAIEPLLALAEGNAEAAADPRFRRMVTALAVAQGEIETATAAFNLAVLRYDAAKRRGFNLVVAKLLNFADIELFAANKAERELLEANFSKGSWNHA